MEAINGTGNELSNVIIGNSANNILNGGAGDDYLSGGAGNDTYMVDSIYDTVIENADEGLDTVESSVSYTLGANIENLTLTGDLAIGGTGNALDNIITGNSASNIINGGAGADIMTGGAGGDTYIVDDVNDVVVEELIAAEVSIVDTVESSIDYTLGANLENLTLTGAAINATGNEIDNQITGNAQDNIINGAAGNDTLDGGDGNDTYIYNYGDGLDTISDTDNLGNIIYRDANGIEYALTGGLLTTGQSYSDATGRFIYNFNEIDSTLTIILDGQVSMIMQNYSLAVSALGITLIDAPISINTPYYSQHVTELGGNINATAFGDVNGDGLIDIVSTISNQFSETLINDGNGGFNSLGISYITSGYVGDKLTLGDFNGDGHIDLVSSGRFGNQRVIVAINDGTGNFTPADLYPSIRVYNPADFAVGDITGDGMLDVVSLSFYGGQSVLANDGNGGFNPELFKPEFFSYGVSGYSTAMALGDLNGDGADEIVQTGYLGASGSYILIERYAQGFFSGTFISGGFGTKTALSIALGDVNGDGLLDIVTGVNNTVEVRTNLGNDYYLSQSYTSANYNIGYDSLTLLDTNGDGNLDIVVNGSSYSSIAILENDGVGLFAANPTVYSTGGFNGQLANADFNGDGQSDIILFNSNQGFVNILNHDPITELVAREDALLSFTGLNVAGSQSQVTAQLSVAHGNLFLDGSAITFSAGAIGESSLTIQGTAQDINAALATLNYQGDANYNGTDALSIFAIDAAGYQANSVINIDVKSVTDNYFFGDTSTWGGMIEGFNSASSGSANPDKLVFNQYYLSQLAFDNQSTFSYSNSGVLVNGLAANAAYAQFIYDSTSGILSFDPDGTGSAEALAIATLGVDFHPVELIGQDINFPMDS